ncbi:MAG: DUF4038 domain-containing protein [Candidatus Latescibacteria bacterium]|nr:DUF4038 domain-containing protein [Candidatus Latescibacterota bacterium]
MKCTMQNCMTEFPLISGKEYEDPFDDVQLDAVFTAPDGTNPYHHPVTIHPSKNARDTVEDPAVLDFDMLQSGHGDRLSVPNTVSRVVEAYNPEPRMPVINGGVCYEGIGEACRQEVQRFMFWVCVLNGATGHTYGANGIWQVNTREKPYGASPHGMAWGNTPWEDAYQLPGSARRLQQKCGGVELRRVMRNEPPAGCRNLREVVPIAFDERMALRRTAWKRESGIARMSDPAFFQVRFLPGAQVIREPKWPSPLFWPARSSARPWPPPAGSDA